MKHVVDWWIVLSVAMLATLACNGKSGDSAGDAGIPAGGPYSCGPNLELYKSACVPLFDKCRSDEVPLPGGGCKRVGVERCAGGIKGPPDWKCKHIGPPAACLPGWEKVKGGWCEPILPPQTCTGLTKGTIGKRTCQPLMNCGSGKWGNIKTTSKTIFVDQGYSLNDSDGSETKPYRTIGAALSAAKDGDHIAVAEGTYLGELDISTRVTIDGRCPQKVTINSQSNEDYATVDVFTIGVRLRGVTITGSRQGFLVIGPGASAELDQVAVVGCGDIGVEAQNATLSVRDSLVSGNRFVGLLLVAAKGTVERTVIRGTRTLSLSDKSGGDGIHGIKGSTLEVTESLIDGNRTAGIVVFGSKAKVNRTVVRETHVDLSDGTLGVGIGASPGIKTPNPSTLSVSDSVVARNHYGGIVVQSSTGTVHRTVVRDTETDGTKKTGRGIIAVLWSPSSPSSTLTVTESLVTGNRETGIHFESSKGSVSRTVVAHTRPTEEAYVTIQGGKSKAGSGIVINIDLGTKIRSDVTISDSLVSGNHKGGVAFFASKGAIQRSIIADTRPDAANNEEGIGLGIAASATTKLQSNVSVKDSLIERNHVAGIQVSSSTATVERTVVRETVAEASSKRYGSGIVANEQTFVDLPSKLTVTDCLVVGNTSTGIGISRSTANLQRTVIRSTGPTTADLKDGEGISVLALAGTKGTSATIRDCIVDTNRSAGIQVENATVTVERSQVIATLPIKKGGLFGDGIQVGADPFDSARVDLADSLVQGNARSGVVFFGVGGSVKRSVLRSGTFSVVLEKGASPIIGERNVYEDNKRNAIAFDEKLEKATIPSMPKR